jgi:hypothetical protein
MILHDYLKIPKTSKNKSVQLYYDVFGYEWGYHIPSPSVFIKDSWETLQNSQRSNANTNGAIFEYLIALCLYSQKILPFYMQAMIAFVPNAIYDIALYTTEENPITLSIKSSLRERYKQADLEGWALKNVHRNALNYLITLSEKESKQVAQKINNGDITGLDKIIVATNKEFDDLIKELKRHSYIPSKRFNVINKGILISSEITKD